MTGSQLSPFPHASVIVGGARSGKSALAERLATAAGRPRVYLATAEAGDAEMAARIARHRRDRGPGWATQEVPHALPAALAALPADAVAVVDCATLWLTNRMLAGADLAEEAAALDAALAACPCPVIVVTNEVGWGIVPDNALARSFRDAQGRLNQRLAARADLAVTVIAGLPVVLKGALPPGVA